MNSMTPHDSQFSLEDEVDLLEYLNAILRFKYRILIVAVLFAVAVFAASKMVDDLYTGMAVVAININDEPGGVSPGKYGAADMLSLIEHDFLVQNNSDNELHRLMARLRSVRFSELFVTENNLMPYIFHKNWDADAKTWKEGFEPNINEAVEFFRRKMRFAKIDDTTGLLNISFNTRNPKLSADLANKFVERFNSYIRENQAQELKDRAAYLNKRLEEIENLELHRSIFRLIETQLAAESLLYARKNYPLEMIQDALPPAVKSYPGRKKWAVITFFGIIFLGIMVSIASVLLKKIKSGLTAYHSKQLEQNDAQPRQKSIEKPIDEKTTDLSSKSDYSGDDWVD